MTSATDIYDQTTMRHVRSRGDTPGIALSGYATEDDVRQSREAGFAVHLAKPVTFEMLDSAIQQVAAARSLCAPMQIETVLTAPQDEGARRSGHCFFHQVWWNADKPLLPIHPRTMVGEDLQRPARWEVDANLVQQI